MFDPLQSKRGAKSSTLASGTSGTTGPQAQGTGGVAQAEATSPKSSTASAPSITLPKGGGAIQGISEKFSANPVSGTGSLTVAIATSPGRSGLGPKLSLSYDSGDGNGPFGVGWKLSLPAITRKTDKGLPRYQDAQESDVFILSGAEDLVPVLEPDGSRFEGPAPISGYLIHRYRPRIEGLFARIERWTRDDGDVHWRSTTKDNILTLYGKDENSRVADSANPRRVFSWLICETRDDKGNVILYEYKEEDGVNVEMAHAHERNRGTPDDPRRKTNRYLKRIHYGNRTPLLDPTGQRPRLLTQAEIQNAGWMFEVVFDYGEHDLLDPNPNDAGNWLCRHDPFSSYRATFEVRTYRLCQRILMFHHFPDEQGIGQDCLVRSTDFVFRDIRNNPEDITKGDPIASFIASIVHSSYKRTDSGDYLKKSLPPLGFEYSQAVVQEDVWQVDAESMKNLPVGLDDSVYSWTDLNSEGIPGILTEQGGTWFYKRNLSSNNQLVENGHEHTAARFGPVEILAMEPAASLANSQTRFMDLAGDGQLDLVQTSSPGAGFYERTDDAGWAPFRAFSSWPNLDSRNPNLKFVDLTGDGIADILITEGHALAWHASLAKHGFGPATWRSLPWGDERGPQLLFDDGTQSVFLSDMSGDGLSDLVRIRNGDICYWPNLGYGCFGAKVTMDHAPWFDYSDHFDQRRIRLADIDGSGTTDIIYLGAKRANIYFNQAGNSWSANKSVMTFPPVDNLSSVQVIDLLGNGTACLVWSSPLPGNARQPMQYIDLMGGQKPHLMIKTINNLGAETHVHYAPSTKFYLEDKAAGKPWITKLPFVVHVVDQVETLDIVSRNRFTTRYKYSHGYYDRHEREFRGFGMVEQLDTESFATLSPNSVLPNAANIDEASNIPPVLTRTWFHTGAFFNSERISNQYEHEYYREGDLSESLDGLDNAQMSTMLLDATILPSAVQQTDGTYTPYTVTVEEAMEACRSLKGMLLRREIYAIDGTDEADRPYIASESNFTVKLLQPRAYNRHAVFFAHPREQVDFHYERKFVEVNGRNVADPRMSHTMSLEVDPFGSVLRSLAINYRRRALPGVNEPEQQETHITLTANRFADRTTETDWLRVGLPIETRTYEMVKSPEPRITDDRIDLFRFESMTELTNGLFPLGQDEPDAAMIWPYEQWDWRRNAADAPPSTRLRLIEHMRTLYRKDDLSGPYNFGQIGSLALPYENYKLAFTAELTMGMFVDSGKLTAAALNAVLAEGKYVHNEGDANWWIPSGQIFYSPNDTDTPEQELAYSRQHFFIPHRYHDPFYTDARSTETVVTYDDYDLLMVETRDALENRITVGERNAAGNIDPNKPGNDYRLLQPRLVTDPNGNRSEVAFDILGLVVGTAVKGKDDSVGDSLNGFEPDLTQAQLDEFYDVADPHVLAPNLLKDATTRIVYDSDRFWRSQRAHPEDPMQWLPAYTATLARETHVSDPLPQGGLSVLISFSYSDGFGRRIQSKIQAEPGPLVEGGPSVNPRWVGSGWTIFNNKGKPVRQYEPFFSEHHRFEFGTQIGVSPILFYDPVERVIATLHPNHTYEKVVFDTWQQTTYDVNDTVQIADPKNDPHIGDFFRRLPEADYLPTWEMQRLGGALGVQEQQAAYKAAVHADTPAVAHVDPLGRTFLTIVHNKFRYIDTPTNDPSTEEFYNTRTIFDIEGNQREVIDANNRIAMRYDYDMLGNTIHQSSMEAGERWMLNDVVNKDLYAWNSRGYQFHTIYDQLQRPVEFYFRNTSEPELLIGHIVYGEVEPNAEIENSRGKVIQLFDQAGVITNNDYDFKGNLLSSQRQYAQEYKAMLDWSTTVPLELPTYTSRTAYDALNRPTTSILPDNSTIHITYNEANLLGQIEVNLRGAAAAIPFVTNIDYNARGQRKLIDYYNSVRTTYEYDPLTFRLTHLLTRRDATNFPDDCRDPAPAGWSGCQVQNLYYTYDPAGNITYIRDDSQQTVYFRNKRVEPSNDFTYNAIYQLIEANGREHLGQTNGRPNPPTAPSAFSNTPVSVDNPNDGNAMGTYLERYLYDAVGNILAMKHLGSDPAHPGWTRNYTYNETSQLEASKISNRLSTTSIGSVTESYRYYGNAGLHGNMTAMPNLPLMQWDYKDQLQATAQQVVSNGGIPEITWYVYDATGQRVRKVTERQSVAGGTPTRLEERLYLGSFELYRKYGGDGSTIIRECETVHIMDGKQRAALIETHTKGRGSGIPEQLTRYQFGNHLSSVVLELDDQAKIISYEEYYPFGATSYQAMRSQTEVPKRYRYTGKERDKKSGLYYHGARYYAPWIARWVACDPTGIKDGVNIYEYVHNNPIQFHDPSGTEKKEPLPTIPDSIKTTGSGNIQYRGRSVDVYYFKGTSNENMLILGGVHQTEKEAINLTKDLLATLQKSGQKSDYNIIFVPNLFDDRTQAGIKRDRGYDGVKDVNRNFPKPEESLEDSKNRGHGVPVDAQNRKIVPENVILIALVEKFTPSRSLSIHDHSARTPANVFKEGEASATVDPKQPGNGAEADFVTREAVVAARDSGVSVKGNLITKDMAQDAKKAGLQGVTDEMLKGDTIRTRYPNETAGKLTPGVTFGNWGSHKGGMDQYLIEVERGGNQANINQWTPIIQSTLLVGPAVVAGAAVVRDILKWWKVLFP